MKFNNLMNQKKYTISAGGSTAGARVWAIVWTVLADGGDERGGDGAGSASFPDWGGGEGEGGGGVGRGGPVAGSAFFPAWGGRVEGEGGGGGEGGPRVGSASFPTSGERGEGGGGGEERSGAGCVEELSIRVEILS